MGNSIRQEASLLSAKEDPGASIWRCLESTHSVLQRRSQLLPVADLSRQKFNTDTEGAYILLCHVPWLPNPLRSV